MCDVSKELSSVIPKVRGIQSLKTLTLEASRARRNESSFSMRSRKKLSDITCRNECIYNCARLCCGRGYSDFIVSVEEWLVRMVIWDATLCVPLYSKRRRRGTCYHHHQHKQCRQQLTPKRQYIFTRLHGIKVINLRSSTDRIYKSHN